MSRTDKKVPEEIKKRNDALKNKNKDGQAESKSKPLELTINRTNKTFQEQMQDLLSKKDKLVKQDAGDGRNKYQVEVNNLKKKIKKYNKNLKGDESKVKFGSLLQGIKKKEKAGTFDRGAEGKAKNALRKKILDKQDGSRRGGVHAGTKEDRSNKLAQEAGDAMTKKKKTKTGPGAR